MEALITRQPCQSGGRAYLKQWVDVHRSWEQAYHVWGRHRRSGEFECIETNDTCWEKYVGRTVGHLEGVSFCYKYNVEAIGTFLLNYLLFQIWGQYLKWLKFLQGSNAAGRGQLAGLTTPPQSLWEFWPGSAPGASLPPAPEPWHPWPEDVLLNCYPPWTMLSQQKCLAAMSKYSLLCQVSSWLISLWLLRNNSI